uniref:Putative secreted protein n=1 Tax=Ixodes ricinus TaxID=34613 RepID=A0A6B0TR15_IXORI
MLPPFFMYTYIVVLLPFLQTRARTFVERGFLVRNHATREPSQGAGTKPVPCFQTSRCVIPALFMGHRD